MTDINRLITDNIELWTSAIEQKTSSGRGGNSKRNLIGIKKLRDLILELAVNGQLVTNSSKKEDTDNSIESLKSIKADLVKNKKIKKPKKLPEIEKEELNPNLPESWGQMRLGDAINVLNGRAYKRHEMLQEGTPLLRVGNLFTSNEWYYSDLKLEADKYIDNGDLIYAWSASFGPFIWEGGKVIYHYHIWKMDIFDHKALDKRFMLHYLAAISEAIKASGNGIAMIHMTKERMEKLVIPVPSLEEQLKIVEKIDELMALCDQLEQQTEASIDAHQLLVEELLSTLTHSENAQEFEQSWTRIAEHFDLLFTTEHSIEQLKQAILQLAVMGKLVPQDPNDEHVDILLERISAHRDERVKAKEIQKPKKLSVENTPSFQIPKSWENVLLNDLVFVTKLAGFEYTKYINLEDSGEIPVIRAQNVRPFLPDLTNLKYIDEETSLGLPRSALDKKCLLVTFIGAGIGDVCVLENDVRRHLAPNVAKVEAFSNFDLDYLCLYLNSPNGRSELFKSIKSTAQPSLSMTTIREIWVSIPPIEEQKRIVLKTRSLLELCEKLKFSISSASMTKVNLAKEIVEKALG
ncbi:restriction endonuclease subunit S [Pseudoalteromonas spongiae]|uniref:restriction endonuclease subunit S n=1 Tax=Pseudoalteromonas spongiae TaxID=298657 RepID=UPI00110AFD37|nr:restriction endonuclease subunit S [Pseudoalteromonas spongiae]TMO82456.1 restriction endonuclease subunit S [Pseudoalteromonas spongiae]